MQRGLSASEAAAYRERGYHFPIDIMPEQEADGLHRRLIESGRLAGGRLEGRMNQKPHLLFPWIADLVRDARILDAVESVLGPNLLCWSSQFFMKQPGDGAFVSWHQDATYWGLNSPDVLTAWIALTPSTREAGCMRVIPGTQRTQLAHADTFAEQNMLSRGQEIAVDVEESQAVDIELRPGQMSLHHVLIVHGSDPNRAALPRVGLAVRYAPTQIRQIGGETASATLVRGRDTSGYFELEAAPEADLHPAAVERHRRIVDRQLGILYSGAAKAGKLGATAASRNA